jgi:hypothetical protein
LAFENGVLAFENGVLPLKRGPGIWKR